MTREWPAGGHATPHATRHATPSTVAYFVIVLYTAALFAGGEGTRLLFADPVITIVTLLLLLASFLALAHYFQRMGRRRFRRERDRRLKELARARIPSIVRDRHQRLDRALHTGISDLANGEDASRVVAVLERGTSGGDLLPRGMPRLYYTMAVDRLRDAAGRDLLEEALELELDLGEAEKCLWAARAEHLRGMRG